MAILLVLTVFLLGYLAISGHLPDSRDPKYSLQPGRDRDDMDRYPA